MVTGCPFCQLQSDPTQFLAEQRTAIALFDAYPVNQGHTLVIPRRHVGTWFEASADERLDLFSLIDHVKELLDREFSPAGYNLGINVGEAAGQTVPHLHVHVIPRYDGDVDDPTGGVRLVIPERGNYLRPGHVPSTTPPAKRPAPLSTGGRTDPFLRQLRPLFAEADDIAILAAFVQGSGVDRLRDALLSAIDRGARVRLLTGDYLHITQARALRTLLDIQCGDLLTEESESSEVDPGHERGALEVRVVESERLKSEASTFHPKSWIFLSRAAGTAFVGSSNLSWAALTSGLEWNLRVERTRDPAAFSAVTKAFEGLWPRGTQIDQAWLETYGDRAAAIQRDLPGWDVEHDPEAAPPEPRDVQAEALAELRRARCEERRDRAMVVLATGLGKTWLAAFDVQQFGEEQGRAPRVLFLAHRVELLRQAARTFRRLFPDRRFGWFAGDRNDLTGDVVFASVMKLGRAHAGREAKVLGLDPSTFDYVVVDEVHHADATTYRRVLSHLTPSFQLGLTATPERADAGDVLGLFDDYVAFEAGIGEGIASEHLVPFRYFGLKDVVDYAPIPWRNTRFDPAKLEAAVQTEARMSRLWEGWQEHSGTRTLVFCCSIQHANFVKSWLSAKGQRVRAAHTGPRADDRAEALSALAEGTIDAVCAVDLFNEGIDLPAIDRVVMLRPTESPVIFLQQLGRGLRRADAKSHLTVIDFVGNHRVFLDRVRMLLSLAGEGAPSLRQFLVDAKPPVLPEGCSVEIELEAIELLQRLLPTNTRQVVVDAFRELLQSRGERPTIGELYRLGYNPSILKAYDGWFEFVADEDQLSPAEQGVLDDPELRAFLADVERREAMTKCFKMVALQALLDSEQLWNGLPVPDLAKRSLMILRRSPELSADAVNKALGPLDQVTPEAWTAYWRKWPLARWAGEGRKAKGKAWFKISDEGIFAPRFAPRDPGVRDAAARFLRELVDYRLARYRRSRAKQPADAASGFECKLITNTSNNPILKLPSRRKTTKLPQGETDVRLPEGTVWQFRFMKEFCNVARPVGKHQNQLPDLLRTWFGPNAGQPGTAFHVRFSRSPDGWWVEPSERSAPRVLPTPARGRLLAFPSMRAAAGWSTPSNTQLGDELVVEEVSLPGTFDREGSFALRASGTSMQGWQSEIHDGDWLVLRWARSAPLNQVLNRVALIARETSDGRTYHLKRVQWIDGKVHLCSDNPEFAPLPATPADTVVALVSSVIRPDTLAPSERTSITDIPAAFGIQHTPTQPVSRIDGHLFLLCQGLGSLVRSDRVAHTGEAPNPGETAFVLGRSETDQPWTYLGVGHWRDSQEWEIPEVDYKLWRKLGKARGASRDLDPAWTTAATQLAERLTSRSLPYWIESQGRRCRVLARARQGGVRIDGGPEGQRPRTVSLQDLGWVLCARNQSEHVDEGLVNRLRYLAGTPKGSTRYIDTQWAMALVAFGQE